MALHSFPDNQQYTLRNLRNEVISKVFKNVWKFLQRSENGAFSVVTRWVATLKLPFPAYQQTLFRQILQDFWNCLSAIKYIIKQANPQYGKNSIVYLIYSKNGFQIKRGNLRKTPWRSPRSAGKKFFFRGNFKSPAKFVWKMIVDELEMVVWAWLPTG